VNRLHREDVAEHKRDAWGGAYVREPGPREHALGRHDEIVAVRGDRLQERLGV
jgi:hypothetical protein